MPPQLLVNILPVSNLASGASTTLAHGLASNGVSVPPTLVFPDRATPIVVSAVTATTVTFSNNGSSTETATFRCERGLSAELDALSIGPMLWQGAVSSGGGGGGTGFTRSKTSLDSGYVVEANVVAVFWNCAGGDATTVLPSPTGNDARIINLKRTDTGLNTLTVTAVSGNIEGGATYVIAGGGGRISLSFQSDNANWWVV